MKSIDVLRSGHRDLEFMLAVFETAASRLQRGGSVRADLLVGALAFFEGFGTSCHHAKEEELLFPLLAKYGVGPEISFVRIEESYFDSLVETISAADDARLVEQFQALDRLRAEPSLQQRRGRLTF